MEIPPDWLDTTARLVLGTLLAALIGFEREVRDKSAGLRTHMLVGLGAAAFSVFAMQLASHPIADNPTVSLDPMRIIAGVAGGLGFLGGGAIIHSKGDIYGMTTAVGIWIAGAIGVGCGVGNFFAVLVTVGVALVCLGPVRYLENWLSNLNESSQT